MTAHIDEETQKDLRIFAHDIRNMIGGISNYAQLLEMMLEKHGLETEKESTQTIVELVKKINELVAKHIDVLKKD